MGNARISGMTNIIVQSYAKAGDALATFGKNWQTLYRRVGGLGYRPPRLPVWPGVETSILTGQFALYLAVY
jgi:hypothetical protein